MTGLRPSFLRPVLREENLGAVFDNPTCYQGPRYAEWTGNCEGRPFPASKGVRFDVFSGGTRDLFQPSMTGRDQGVPSDRCT